MRIRELIDIVEEAQLDEWLLSGDERRVKNAAYYSTVKHPAALGQKCHGKGCKNRATHMQGERPVCDSCYGNGGR